MTVRARIALAAMAIAACAHDSAPAKATREAPQQCTVRFVAGRVLVDGAPSTTEHALEYCSGLRGAVVYVDDHAQDAAWHSLEVELRTRSVHIYVSGQTCGNARCGEEVRFRSVPAPASSPAPVGVVQKR
jgi:hypothetical protein